MYRKLGCYFWTLIQNCEYMPIMFSTFKTAKIFVCVASLKSEEGAHMIAYSHIYIEKETQKN